MRRNWNGAAGPVCRAAATCSPVSLGRPAAEPSDHGHRRLLRACPQLAMPPNPRRLTSRRLRDTPIGARWSATQATLYLKEQLARSPHEFSDALAFRDSFASIAAMLERVLVASRGA